MPYPDLNALRNDVNTNIIPNGNREIEGIEMNRILNGLVDFIQNNDIETVLTVGNTTTKNLISSATLEGLDVVVKSKLNGTGLNQYLTTDSNGKIILKALQTSDISSIVDSYIDTKKGVANGIAPLNSSAKIDTTYLPDAVLGNVKYKGTYNIVTDVISSDDPALNGQPLPAAGSGNTGFYFIVQGSGTVSGTSYTTGDWIISNGSAGWAKVDNSDAVSTVFGRIGNVIAVSGDYNTSQVTENPGFLYYTDARARLALTGDATSGISYSTSTGVIALSTTGVSAGTYNNVTVDIYGRVTAGSNVSYELQSNKATDLTSPDNTKYPTTLAVSTAIGAIPTPTLASVTAAGNTTSTAILLGGVTAAGGYDLETASKVRVNTNTYFGNGANNDNLITMGDAGKTVFRKTTGLAEVLWITNDGTVRLLKSGYVNLTATSKWITTDSNGDLIGKVVDWTDVQNKPSWIGSSAPTLQVVTTSGNSTTLDIEMSTDKKIGNRLSQSDDYGWLTFFASADKFTVFKNTATTNGGFRFETPTSTNIVIDRNGKLTANNTVNFTGSITAASALANGLYIDNTLIAAANNDILAVLDINPTFTNGAFTGVGNYGLRLRQNTGYAIYQSGGSAFNYFNGKTYFGRTSDIDATVSSLKTQFNTAIATVDEGLYVLSSITNAQKTLLKFINTNETSNSFIISANTRSTGTYAYSMILDVSGTKWGIEQNVGSNYFALYTGSTNPLIKVDSGQRIGIGIGVTINTTTKITVGGGMDLGGDLQLTGYKVRHGGYSDQYIEFQGGTGRMKFHQPAGGFFYEFYINNANYFRIDESHYGFYRPLDTRWYDQGGSAYLKMFMGSSSPHGYGNNYYSIVLDGGTSTSHCGAALYLDSRTNVPPFRFFVRNNDNNAAFNAFQIDKDGTSTHFKKAIFQTDTFSGSTNYIRGSLWDGTYNETTHLGMTFVSLASTSNDGGYYWRIGRNGQSDASSKIVMYLNLTTVGSLLNVNSYLTVRNTLNIITPNSGTDIGVRITNLLSWHDEEIYFSGGNQTYNGAAIRSEFQNSDSKKVLSFWTNDGSSNTALVRRMSIDGEGRVGIGAGTKTSNASGGWTGLTALLHVKGANGYNQFRLETTYTPSATGDANGNTGDWAWDDNYVYVKTSAGWKRSALNTF